MTTAQGELLARILVLSLGGLATVWVGGKFTKSIVQPFADELEDDSGLEQAGRVIGMSERTLIFVFICAGVPKAIGFLITAKSIFRFEEVSDAEKRKHAEYVIVGTLVSFAWAVTVALLFEWIAFDALPPFFDVQKN